jgi:spore coat assembly protein
VNFKIGDVVSRKSYNNDVVFQIIAIQDNVAFLKGSYVRLYADAPLDDLVLTDNRDEYEPDTIIDSLDRDEFFYLPGKILHLDGDEDYLNKSLDYYKKNGVFAVGKCINEKEMHNYIINLLEEYKPDIVVITGHDAIYEKDNTYKNSSFFIKCVKNARIYEKSHEKLVIIAGACQSDYENLIKSGANFASSPKRVNIHALDPAVIAVNVALTDRSKSLDIKALLNKTKYGKSGIGGLLGNGMMYVGYPR